MGFSITLEEKSSFSLLSLEGRLIENTQTEKLVDEAEKIIEGGQTKLAINLEAVDYMNSSGLNALVGTLTKARNVGGEVVLINPSVKIKQLFIITKLNNVFSIASSIEEAEQILSA